jgi:hypothetical protein
MLPKLVAQQLSTSKATQVTTQPQASFDLVVQVVDRQVFKVLEAQVLTFTALTFTPTAAQMFLGCALRQLD